MSTPKRHHFVPKVLLKRFTDDEGWLHSYNKLDSEKTVRKARPDSIFVRSHYYSELETDGSRDATMENWLSKLEDSVSPVLDKVIEAVAHNRLPNLKAAEKHIWTRFFLTQWRRVPDLHDQTKDDFASQWFDGIIDSIKEEFPNRDSEINSLRTEEQKYRMIRNAYIRMLEIPPSEPERVINERGIVLLSICNKNKSFIIGSRPVIQMNFSQGRTLADYRSEMWLPISSKVAIGVGNPWEREKLLHLNDARTVRYLNTSIARSSTSFASCCGKLTASIAKS